MTDNADDPNASSDIGPQKQLLLDAAAEIRADQVAREKARPKNVGEGTWRLLSDSLGGSVIGIASVLMGPVQGYKQAGPKGILSGAIGGVACGVATAGLGIGSGLANFVQGANQTASKLNPPRQDPRLLVSQDADIASRSPQTIKNEYLSQRKFLYSDLMAELSAESAAASMDGLGVPIDDELYQVLEVGADATPAQLRKSYYRMAQKFHPDKHPDDPEATEKFQKISNAYQILSDPVKREEYHRVGASAASGNAAIDPKALFALMFADFEHIVGDLATATILSYSVDNSEDNPEGDGGAGASSTAARLKKREKFQKLREAHLVKLLNRRLEIFLSGQEESFIAQAKLEVAYLREQPFGRDCLHTAGYIYRKRSAKLLDQNGPFAGVANFFEDIGEKTHSLKSQVRALEGGVKALSASSTATEHESADETARREAVSTLGAVWLASVVDIECTLRHVVSEVLHLKDKQKMKRPDAALKKKADGLMILGKIFAQA